MMGHLGGPESPAKIAERQARYARGMSPGEGRVLKIVDTESGTPVGFVGYWESTLVEDEVYEIGWSVIPAFQGRGLAAAATAQAVSLARAERRHRFLHAFPSVDNRASNAICRKLGFELVGPCDIEYPPGRPMQANDWRLDLTAAG